MAELWNFSKKGREWIKKTCNENLSKFLIICSYLKNECILNKQTNKKRRGGFSWFCFFPSTREEKWRFRDEYFIFWNLVFSKKISLGANKKGGKEWNYILKRKLIILFFFFFFFCGFCNNNNKHSPPLDFLHYGVNLSILLTPGKEIKWDSISSGERRWKRSKEKGGNV